jgi:hypothetical protein
MVVTYRKEKNKYVDQSGRQVTVAEYGKDFYNCSHDYANTGRYGTTIGANGKHVAAAAYQCRHCRVYVVMELGNKK